jgi:hypothetical protein
MTKRIVFSLLPPIIGLSIMTSVIQLSLAYDGLFLPQLLVSGAIIFLLLSIKANASSEVSD